VTHGVQPDRPAGRVPLAAAASSGTTDWAQVEFIVDSTGYLRGESVKLLAASDPGLLAPARATILRTRFTPARCHERAVGQLNQWRVEFVRSPQPVSPEP
jgi:hypothetical protein